MNSIALSTEARASDEKETGAFARCVATAHLMVPQHLVFQIVPEQPQFPADGFLGHAQEISQFALLQLGE